MFDFAVWFVTSVPFLFVILFPETVIAHTVVTVEKVCPRD